MITMNEIKNQLEITRSILSSTHHEMSETEWSFAMGYKKALEYVLGDSKAEYDKEDI